MDFINSFENLRGITESDLSDPDRVSTIYQTILVRCFGFKENELHNVQSESDINITKTVLANIPRNVLMCRKIKNLTIRAGYDKFCLMDLMKPDVQNTLIISTSLSGLYNAMNGLEVAASSHVAQTNADLEVHLLDTENEIEHLSSKLDELEHVQNHPTVVKKLADLTTKIDLLKNELNASLQVEEELKLTLEVTVASEKSKISSIHTILNSAKQQRDLLENWKKESENLVQEIYKLDMSIQGNQMLLEKGEAEKRFLVKKIDTKLFRNQALEAGVMRSGVDYHREYHLFQRVARQRKVLTEKMQYVEKLLADECQVVLSDKKTLQDLLKKK